MMISRGVTLFPYYDLGACGKFTMKMTSSIAGTNHVLLEK